MLFTDDQKSLLEAKLDPGNVKGRKGANGATVPYVEAWHAIAEANRIFGHGGWESRTVEMREVHPPVMFTPPPTRDNPHPKQQVVSCYAAKVRVTVWDASHTKKCVREGWSAHRSFSPTVGEAVENAIKGSESDALKRALRSFGWSFGLALYDKDRRNVGTPEVASPRRQIQQGQERPMAPIDEGFDQSQPERQTTSTTSQRALAASPRPPASTANGRDRTALPY
jgi:recombination DNA repair RAD52 pathway protein